MTSSKRQSDALITWAGIKTKLQDPFAKLSYDLRKNKIDEIVMQLSEKRLRRYLSKS